MANEEHVAMLKQGVHAWNAWRHENRNICPDLVHAYLCGEDLSEAYLGRADLSQADLSGANLSRANLSEANLSQADLNWADLNWANLGRANLSGAALNRANLGRANLREANLGWADLSGADLSEANLGWTIFARTNLEGVIGLESCRHARPSSLDFMVLKSRPLPLAFLRGVGLPDTLIRYLPSLFNQPIQFYSCFISYSAKDEEFAERLHADLQNNGVRCWFAPHDMPIGAKILDAIDEAIRLRDKVLLILSEGAIASTGSKVR